MKFFAPSGLFLDADENARFWKLAENQASYVPWDMQGVYTLDERFIDNHIDQVLSLSYIDVEKIRKRKFKVALDCVNAAGGIIVPPLLERFGCELIPLHCEVTGIFGHTPEPIPENLTALCNCVRTTHADLGIAVDPDVERLVLINEQGEPFIEEYSIATCVKFILEKDARTLPQTVVVNLSTTRAVEDIARQYGATTVRTSVGEINIAKKNEGDWCDHRRRRQWRHYSASGSPRS